MPGDINVGISYDGTEKGGQQLDALVQKLGGLTTAEERAVAATTRFERALDAEAQKAAQARVAIDAAARSHGTFTSSASASNATMTQTQQRLGQIGTAFGAVGNAARGLSPRIGEVAQGVTAIGSAVAITATTMGTFGMVMGGITIVLGAVSLAMRAMEADTDAVRSTTAATVLTFDDLLERMRRVEAERSRQSRIEMGVGEVDEQIASANIVGRQLGPVRLREDNLTTRLSASDAERRRQGRDPMSLEERRRTQEQLRAVRAERMELEAEFNRRLELAQQAERDQAAIEQEDVETFLEEGARRDREGTRRRRGGGGRRQREAPRDFFAEAEAENEIAMMQRLGEVEEEVILARRRHEEENARIFQQNADDRLAALEELKEKEREAAEIRLELLEKEKEAARRGDEERAEHMREVTGVLEDNISSIAGAFTDAFQAVIEGQKTAEEAAAEAGKTILKGIGDQMVQIGIKEAIEGFANVVSAPPVAATKIPAGIALIAAGVGLGAAGAAIPSGASGGASERPRRDADSGDRGGGPTTLIYNVNSPIVAAANTNQLARALNRQAAGTGFPSRRD